VQQQLEHVRRRRWRRILLVGIGVSLLVHATLLLYLSSIYRSGGGDQGDPILIELAFVPETSLSTDAAAGIVEIVTPMPSPALDLAAVDAPSISAALAPVPDMATGPAGGSGLPTLGGAGTGTGPGSGTGDDSGGAGGGLGGGAGGTSFFGISSQGTRFAYIVDRSMSMAEDGRLEIAKRELVRSLEELPDYANFCVVFFSTDLLIPEMQDGWLRARGNVVARFAQWLATSLGPGGGTVPGPAFITVLNMPVRPDVIFFMTDGEIHGFAAEEVAALNRRGEHVVINTIAFGDPSSQELLKQIAMDSGGSYRFVPTGGR
jgi:von Willebrand factor type A domain